MLNKSFFVGFVLAVLLISISACNTKEAEEPTIEGDFQPQEEEKNASPSITIPLKRPPFLDKMKEGEK